MKIRILFLFLFLPLIGMAQQRDSRVREYLPPTRIVWQQHGELITGIENLLKPGNGQSELGDVPRCVMKNNDGQQPAILLDFGKELQGGIQIVTGIFSPQKPVRIRVRFGESASEAMAEIDGQNGAGNDHAMRDFEVSLPWLGVMEVGNSGFRFARIDLIDEGREVHLEEVRAISTFRDIPYLGSFRSNDERLNQVWQTGAYTVHLNMQEYLWDGIKRDRLVWLGDLHPEVMTVNAVFGQNEVVPKSLDLIRDLTPVPQWMNGISSYSLWWVIIQHDWYLYHGDLVYLKEQQPYLTQLLRHILTKFDTNGKEQLDGNRFLDWPSSENPKAIDAGLQSLMVMTLQMGETLCTTLGDTELATACREMYIKTKSKKASPAVKKAFLSAGIAPDAPGSKQGAALMALTDIMDPKEADEKYLSVNGGHGFSTFYGYYMLRAMALAGNYTGAMEVIRQYWGAMLDLGATTFWEDFNLDWLPNAAPIDNIVPEGKKDIHGDYGAYCYEKFRHSLCHGWASGPTAWLSENVLGVKVIEPGCRVVRIEPHLGDLQWVEGTFPTPYGLIKVRHEKGADGKVISKIDAPKEIQLLQ
ncbi:alpha-L-rhamnosidase C-terminal domain-containing protein [Parabacteroides sp. PF5-6]|uniref:alpha-L-rhamnosidase-related protein n=1 Tax=Parabacteroides sp. PF5-6 TaxID=1742403 RepID=UPI002405FED2|nr:alpha-L-rhamnosidase C-terminal domain-containing protein [Parabacteroides sp. PF5-6]MDF9831546.1 alpha-L-rhamnosidase [Parabacteroides sp. PF5-6]